jgi:LacI family transcriptional regulator
MAAWGKDCRQGRRAVGVSKIGRVRIVDVAREAGVSIATVDRVLNKRIGVRPVTTERVWSAVARLNLGAPNAVPTADPYGDLRIDFVLSAGAGPSFEENLMTSITEVGEALGVETGCRDFESFNPAALSDALRQACADGADGIAFHALEHPLVRAAVDEAAAQGVPSVAILSDLSGSRRLGFAGIDNRAAGRTAGYLMGRFLGGRGGRVAILAGSHLYRSHDEREIGFRGVCRKDNPLLEVLDLVLGNDEPESNYRKTREQLERHDDLVGIYNIGSGNRGVARALQEQGRDQDVVFIAHHLTTVSRQYLLDGTIDAVIHQDMGRLAEAAIRIILAPREGRPSESAILPFEIIVRENIFH